MGSSSCCGNQATKECLETCQKGLNKTSNSDFLLVYLITGMFQFLNPREIEPNRPSDACRLHGTLQLTKVAGNFHVTAGKVLPLPMRAHAHIAPLMDDDRFNYSHRINKFAFGESSMSGLVHPLEGDEVITDKGD